MNCSLDSLPRNNAVIFVRSEESEETCAADSAAASVFAESVSEELEPHPASMDAAIMAVSTTVNILFFIFPLPAAEVAAACGLY